MPSDRETTLGAWIAAHATDLSIDDSGIDRIAHMLPPTLQVLGLGEPMHGGEEFLILRNRLLQRLAKDHGYTAIAVESSFPAGFLADRYVQGAGESYDEVRDNGFSHGFGALEANQELIAWMRQANRAQFTSRPLRFYGFDSPTEMTVADSPRELLAVALEQLEALGAGLATRYREKIEPLLGADADWENPAAAFDPAKSIGQTPAAGALRHAAEDLVIALETRRPQWRDSGGDPFAFVSAIRHATLARQMLAYHALMATASDQRIADLLALRDLMMADNLEHILAVEQSRGGKVLVFAHNAHLQRSPMHWQLGPHALTWWPAGAHLSTRLGNAFANIGTGIATSPDNGIAAPEPGTLEALLGQGTGRFIPTAPARFPPGGIIPPRSTTSKNPTYFALSAQSLTDFDYLVVLPTCTYTRGGPHLPH